VWTSPFLPIALSVTGFVSLIAVLVGQRIQVLRRQAFFQTREIAALNARLDLDLRAKVVDRSRELTLALGAAGKHEPEALSELPPGAVIQERFALQARLGSGGMGVVYRAHDQLVDRRVAIKVVRFAAGPRFLERFLHEVEAMAVIVHPAVARSFHVDVTEDGRLFQVQELVDGEPLDRLLRFRGPLKPGHVARIGAALAEALGAAHAVGVVHRDVKPSNVMLTRGPEGLKLLDFGISKLRGSQGGATQVGMALGTPSYMAPEQRSGEVEVGPPADVFALGTTLAALLCGAPGQPLPASVPAALAAEIQACLALAPGSGPRRRRSARGSGRSRRRSRRGRCPRRTGPSSPPSWTRRSPSAPERL
jgi:serine/threonine protein kinase